MFAAPFTVDDVDRRLRQRLPSTWSTSCRASWTAAWSSPGERLDGQRAFQLLDPIRRFAGRPPGADPDDTLGRLHRHVLEVLAAADNRLGSQELLLRRLDSEQPNLQAVLTWVGRTGQPSGPLLRALGDVWVWMLARGYLRQTADAVAPRSRPFRKACCAPRATGWRRSG